MKTNRITAKCVNGIYKDQELEIVIGTNHQDCIVKANGQIVKLVQKICIKMEVNKPTIITMEKIKS